MNSPYTNQPQTGNGNIISPEDRPISSSGGYDIDGASSKKTPKASHTPTRKPKKPQPKPLSTEAPSANKPGNVQNGNTDDEVFTVIHVTHDPSQVAEEENDDVEEEELERWLAEKVQMWHSIYTLNPC